MGGLTGLLKDPARPVRFGQVAGQTASGRYVVKIGSREVTARSGVGDLDVGAAVVLNETEAGLVIVGYQRTQSRRALEVVIDG